MLLKVMVVDDEPIVRLAIKSLVDWGKHGFDLGCEASNGRQALKLFEENNDIDIVITDINMPVMDGLELIAELSRYDNAPEIIVLSAYNDYDLVRRAFKLGVKDYILKTEMDPESLLRLLKEIKLRVEEERVVSTKNGHQAAHIKNIYRDEVLRELVNNSETLDIKDKAGSIGLKLSENNLVVCFLWVDDYQLVVERYGSNSLNSFITSTQNAVEQVLREAGNGEVLTLTPHEYVLILSFEAVSLSGIRNKLIETTGKIRHALLNYVNIKVSIGVSDVKSSFESLPALLNQAEGNARLRFVFGKGRTIFPEDAMNINDSASGSLIGREGPFTAALKAMDGVKAIAELDKLLEGVMTVSCGKIEKFYGYYMEILFVIIKFLNEIGEDTSEVFGSNVDFYEKITRFETREEINIWIKNITSWVVSYLNDKKDAKLNRAIIRAKEFIKANFNNNITLKMVSDYVGLSESHFSHSFTKNAGMTFTDYLTAIRIETAKKLMSTSNKKVYEIASDVGYSSVEHFSRIFKKVTGQSPNNYKSI